MAGVNSPPYLMSPTGDEWVAAEVNGVEPDTVLIFDKYDVLDHVIILTEMRQELIEGDPIDTVMGSVLIPADRIDDVMAALRNAAERTNYVEDLETQAQA